MLVFWPVACSFCKRKKVRSKSDKELSFKRRVLRDSEVLLAERSAWIWPVLELELVRGWLCESRK